MRRIMKSVTTYTLSHLNGRNIRAFVSGLTFVAGILVFLGSAFAGSFLIGTPWWQYPFFGACLAIVLLIIGSAIGDDGPEPVLSDSNG